jgi:hypothetical protein
MITPFFGTHLFNRLLRVRDVVPICSRRFRHRIHLSSTLRRSPRPTFRSVSML